MLSLPTYIYNAFLRTYKLILSSDIRYHKNHAGMNYAVKLYKEGNMTVNQICEITNVSRASLYRKLSEENK